jgi:predicted phosphodiesterase
MSRRSLQNYLVSRRQFLAHAARMSGASLASVPLIGCGAEEETVANAADASSADAGVDAMTDSGIITDAAGIDAMTDAGGMDTAAASPWFRFAVVADTHIIDEWYEGPESNELDTTSMFETTNRLTAARDFLMALDPAPEFICHVGDLIHDYPSYDLNFFFQNETRLDFAKNIMDGFGVPWHTCLGNHDYEFRDVAREDTHGLFRDKLGIEPYSSFDHKGWKFVFLDTYSGETHNPASPNFMRGENGSMGEQQLLWFEGQLQEGKPTFVFMHQMLSIMQSNEVQDLDVLRLMRDYADTIKFVVAGHTHRWIDMGTTYGPGHMVMGATRYDEDCFIVCDVNTETGEFVFANQHTWQPVSVNADRWEV